MINKLYPPRKITGKDEKNTEPEFIVAAAPEPEPAEEGTKQEHTEEENVTTGTTAQKVRTEEKPSTLTRMKNWLNRIISEEE